MQGTMSSETLLKVEHAKVRYRNGAIGLIDGSFVAHKGQLVAIFGANGAGKTTLVRAVTGFMHGEGARVIEGQVQFLGEGVRNREPHQISRMGAAFVPERNKVFANFS